MLISKITIQDILERKVKYLESSDRCEFSEMLEELKEEKLKELELLNEYEKGERKAYKEMILDCADMSEEVFVKKYFEILEKIKKYFEGEEKVSDEAEIEQLSGYNNGIVFALTLLNPRYEYDTAIWDKDNN